MKGSYRPDDHEPAAGPKSRVKLPSLSPDYDDTRGARRRYATGAYIRTWMRKLKLSYDDVAEVLGVHPITVRNWEKAGRIRPIVKLAFDKAFRDKPRHTRRDAEILVGLMDRAL